MDQDLVMAAAESVPLRWRIIQDRIRRLPCHTDRALAVIENGDRESRRSVEFHKTSHELENPEVGVDFENHKKSYACQTRLTIYKSSTMNSVNRNEIIKDSETNSRRSDLNDINVNKRVVFRRDKVDEQNDTNASIHDDNTQGLTTINILSKRTHRGSKNRSDPISKTENNLCPKNLFYSLVRFVTVFNVTRLKVFFFIFLIGHAFLQSVSRDESNYHSSWIFPSADAKAVVSLSKNVLVTDAGHKQVSSIGKIDPLSESTKETQGFSDFSDYMDSDRDTASDYSSDISGYKRSLGKEMKLVKKKAISDQELGIDEYDAYDDSTGEATDTTDPKSDKKTERKKPVDEKSNYQDQYSDGGDEELEDEDDGDEDEQWSIGDMNSQPIFVPPGMNVDSRKAGVKSTEKSSTEAKTTDKLEDKTVDREIPEYMLKLYQKFTQKHYSHPASDTVRSFSNINDDILFNISSGNELPGAKTRNHTLVFNISSFPRGEQINLAQLRLYKLVERDRNTYIGDDRKVSLYEVITQDDGTRHLKLVSQKHIYGRNSGWESFDVTPAVRRWVAEIENGAVQILEVTIESIFNSLWGNDVDISVEPRNKKEPLLVVFSKQVNKRLVHQQERDELLQHELTLSDIEDVDNFTTSEPPSDSPSSLSSSRSSNSRQDDDDDDDNDDDDDEEEDDDGEDFSNEDSYGSIDEMTSYAKVTQSMRTGKEYFSRSKQQVRVKRSKSSSKRNICRRTKLEVDFREIQGHEWIVAPKIYQAFECSGKCYFPIGDHLRPTKHAIIRANMHIRNKKVTRPCCVPTKLDSISLLYLDSKTNGYTFKYKFEGMKVAECGCR